MFDWFRSGLAVVSLRGRLWAFLNLVFFVSVFGVAFAVELLFPPELSVGWQPRFPELIFGDTFLVIFLSIFFSNLILSAFVFVTLPGFVFFPLSGAMLVYRAFLWGLLLRYQPTWLLLAALPTLVLEGEGYVLAAVGGTVAGVSWVKPKRVYKEEDLSRFAAFKKALKECLGIYVFVSIVLLVASAVETVTLTMVAY